MGDFVVRVHAVGNHGHNRDVAHGEVVPTRCEYPQGCVDCVTNEYVEKLKSMGSSVKVASMTHWPSEFEGYTLLGEIKDDLLTGLRRGNF